MKKYLFFILFPIALLTHSQVSFNIDVSDHVNYKKLVKKAKTHVVLSNSAQVELKVDLWKDNMPTTDAVKDYIQFNISITANAGAVNVNPKKAYFLYYTGESSKPSQVITYSYVNENWKPDVLKTKLIAAPNKVVVEFEDTQSKKIHTLKNEGPFKVEEVH